MSANLWEAQNRAVKAASIAAYLNASGTTAEAAKGIVTQDARDLVATLAGENSPSDATWQEVVRLLEGDAKVHAAAQRALARLVAQP